MVFESDPRYEGDAKGEVEETFVGDRKNDKGWREGEEDNQESVEVVIAWLEAMQNRDCDRGNCRNVSFLVDQEACASLTHCEPSHKLRPKRQTLL